MAGIKYSEVQIEELRKNKYIKTVTEKYITFTDEFKIQALELDKRYFLPKEIFKEFWFPEYIINTNLPKQTLATLRYKERKGWIKQVISSKKWRKKSEKINFENMTKDEKIKYLETENAYLKELYKIKHWNYP